MLGVGRLIESFADTAAAVGKYGLEGLKYESTAERAANRAVREAIGERRLARAAIKNAGEGAEEVKAAREAYAEVRRSTKAKVASASHGKMYDDAVKYTKRRNRAMFAIGGLGVANSRGQNYGNQHSSALLAIRNRDVGTSSGAMQRLDYGSRASGAYTT